MSKSLNELIEEEKNIEKSQIKSELEKNAHKLRSSSDERYEIWSFDENKSDFLINYIGLTREIAFRGSGGGTGHDKDIDNNDYLFKQLIVVDKKTGKLAGGYRYAEGKDLIDQERKVISPTAHLFNMSQEFISDYLPKAIELGRSYSFSFRALNALVDGLGAIITESDSQYLFGKITRYPNKNKKKEKKIKQHLDYFLSLYHKDKKKLLEPKIEEKLWSNFKTKIKNYKLRRIYSGNDYDKDFAELSKQVGGFRSLPPMLSVYYKLSNHFKSYGTAINKNFGNVQETAIMVDSKKLTQFAIEHFILSYKDTEQIKNRFFPN